jgi:general secretion pathway protein C
MWKRYLWIKNIIFLVALSYLAANIIHTIILSRLPKPDLLDRKQTKNSRQDISTKSLNTYTLISRKNIFNSKSTGDGSSGAQKAQKSNEPLKKTELKITLVGTIVGAPQNSFAIIEDNEAKKQDLYQIDDMIQDQARILEISRCRVLIMREGQQEVLECPEPEEKGKTGSKTVAYTMPSQEYPGVKKMTETEYAIDEKEVENALNNINQLMTQLRIVPNFEDGKANGFKVFAIKPNSIFENIGLKNGDVIQKVNDREITTPDKAFQSFQELRNERNLTVGILRKGEQKTLNYQIR